ncbi:hypothetical protein K6U47_09785, partial [Vibrio furnissii]|nr:hypothetical protein [Vibrio furnissii]
MMKYIYVFIGFLFISCAYSSERGIDDIINQSYIETENDKIPSFKNNDFEVYFEKNGFVKNEEGLNNESLSAFYVIDGKQSLLFHQGEFNPYGQSALVLTCKSEDKTVPPRSNDSFSQALVISLRILTVMIPSPPYPSA